MSAAGRVLRVGPLRTIRTIGEAARLARAGDVVEVDAGAYVGDVAVWEHDGVAVRAAGGRVVLHAGGAAAEGKGIWVVRARGMSAEGFDFSGARVPARNGAGIRLDGGSLRVARCSFVDNEMGLLTGNDANTELDVVDCEFAHNRRDDGHNHNLYAGTIARLFVVGSHLHHAHVGHLLKSRAALAVVVDNRLTDEDGRASYELEFANGGIAWVIGNRIQQSKDSENPVMLSFGAEGWRWPRNELHVIGNTFVDDLVPAGTWIRVAPGKVDVVRVLGNTLVGQAGWEVGANAEIRANVVQERTRRGS